MKLHKTNISQPIFLLVVLVSGMTPQADGRAANKPTHTVYDAVNLLYLSDAILTPDDEVDDTPEVSLLYSPAKSSLPASDADSLLARIIHAKKMERNDLEANCALLISQLQAQGKNCEADQVLEYCETKRSEINSQIGFYHKVRGDQRKLFTQVWHSIKGSAESIWYRIGPTGRNFLRNLGQESLQIVASGGTLSGTTLKGLVKHQIKAMGRQRIRETVYKGVERLLLGQMEIARAAGVDICAEEPATEESSTGKEETAPSGAILQYTLTAINVDFYWDTLLPKRDQFDSCGSLWPSDDSEHFQPITFTLTIDTKNKTLTGHMEGQRKIENYTSGGYAGGLDALENQSFTILLDGPYQFSEPNEGVVQAFQGTAQLTLTMDGKRFCTYSELPAGGGDPVVKTYWVTGADTKKLTTPYTLYVTTYNGETGFMQLILTSQSWGENTNFSFISQELELSPNELDEIWQE
jgi:hypothetical protein